MVLFFGIGCMIGIILFFICERKGLIHKWHGLSKKSHPSYHLGLNKKLI